MVVATETSTAFIDNLALHATSPFKIVEATDVERRRHDRHGGVHANLV